MDTAQHAGNILEAWRFRDLSSFNTALNEAFLACTAGVSVSRLEAERKELLQSLVEHLRICSPPPRFEILSSSAPVILLRHLSASRSPKQRFDSSNEKNFAKNSKVRLENVRNVLQNSNAGRATEPAIGRTT